MSHCHGDSGGNAFGGGNQRASANPPLAVDPNHDVLAAMVDWVEYGNAPTEFVAAKWNNHNVTQCVQFTRKLFLYPQKEVYKGGDQNSSDSIICA